jgi:hypothetical protein
MIEDLIGVSPWLRFIGVIHYICCALVISLGVAVVLAAPILDQAIGGFTILEALILGGVAILTGLFMLIPARFIYKFGADLRDFNLSHKEHELELAFKNNRAFWRFHGLIIVTILALIPIVIMVIAAITFSTISF